MSTVYAQEPPTNGKVVLVTNYGEIEIDLWGKEAPRACRNFIQLCLEGYYDKTVFHRLIKDFMVQGGDPTGTGTGGESIYGGKPFLDEFHSRLKFCRRGIVAMANPGEPNMNESQFFMAVDQCPWLDKKHTIFGKIDGETIFNLLRISQLETDKADRPTSDPLPRIEHALVILNPFDDIVPRSLASGKKQLTSTLSKDQAKPDETLSTEPASTNRATTKRPATFKTAIKNRNLISFADDDNDEDEDQAISSSVNKFKKRGIRSQHEVMAEQSKSTGLSTQAAISQEELAAMQKRRMEKDKAKEQLKRNIKTIVETKKEDASENETEQQLVEPKQVKINEDGTKASRKRLDQMLDHMEASNRRRSRSRSRSPTSKALERAAEKLNDEDSLAQSARQEQIDLKRKVDEEKLKEARSRYISLRADLMKFKKDSDKMGSNLDENSLSVQARFTPLQLQRQRFMNQMKNTKHRENETMAKFNDFISNLRKTSANTRQPDRADSDSGEDQPKAKPASAVRASWMTKQVAFHTSSDKAYQVTKAQEFAETVGTGKNFENYLAKK